MFANLPMKAQSVLGVDLTVAGNTLLLRSETTVAVVGARAASRRGVERAGQIAAALSGAGLTVASGGALGIDSAAHAGALAAGGPTLAVVAGGVETPYPTRNRPLFHEILARGGAVVSPFGSSTPVRRWHFVRRNQVLAGLARAVVVIEAGAGSGSFYTVAAARAAGRLVAACPGSPGSDALLREGAALVETPEDLLFALRGEPRKLVIEMPADPVTASVLGVLVPDRGRGADEVADLAGLTLRQTLRELGALEAAGLALVGPGGSYLRAVFGS